MSAFLRVICWGATDYFRSRILKNRL